MAAFVETGQVPSPAAFGDGMAASAAPPAPAPSGRDRFIPKIILYQASIEVPAESAERIADALEAALSPAATAVTLFDRGGGRFEVSAHYAAPPSAATLAALIHDAAGASTAGAGAAPGVVGPLRVEPVAEADWVTLSQAQRQPVRAGRFLVHGSHDRGRVAGRACSIEIDAGQAFGTAQHASTRGCLLALDRLLKQRLLGQRRPRFVVDIGTGSGILAIAAAKALKVKVLASDSDPLAVAVARDNARQNGVAGSVRVVQAEGLAHPLLRRARADLLFANLLLRPLLELAPGFARAVRLGGVCVLSGLTYDQARRVEARFRSLGFRLDSRILLDGWATLLLTRRSARKVRVRD